MIVKFRRSMSDNNPYWTRRRYQIRSRLAELPWNIRLANVAGYNHPGVNFKHGVFRRAQRPAWVRKRLARGLRDVHWLVR